MIISDFLNGIWLESSSNNEIINNMVFRVEGYGIRISQSNYNVLRSNTVKNTHEAITLEYSNHNILYDNKAEDNRYGITLFMGTDNKLRNNIMVANKYGFDVGMFFLEYYINDVDTSNTVDGKPIYYWINRYNEVVPPDAGCIVIVNSSRITVNNLKLEKNSNGVILAYTKNSVIEGTTVTENGIGINLDHSDYNLITRNNITTSDGGGICLVYSHHNTVTYNFVKDSNSSGIWLEDTYYNKIIGNTVVESRAFSAQEFDGAGVLVDDSKFTEVIGNNLTRNLWGIVVGATPATSNLIIENDIVMNNIGLVLFDTKPNTIYHNNFVENKEQVRTYAETYCTFDAGYPSGGNYWSDYLGWDANNDEIGESPYVIDENNQDNYPLMSPYGGPPLPKYTLTITATAGGTTSPTLGNYTHSKGQNVPVSATSRAGYLFDHWELDNVNIGTANPVNVTMNTNHTLHAVFSLAYTLNIETTTGGTINPTSGTYTYTAETIVTVTATPNTDYYFDHWELDGVNYTNNPISIRMNMNHTLKASFARVQYTLTVTTTDEGTTNPTPGTYTYWSRTTVSIAALPNTGYYLDHWELDNVNIKTPNPINVTMNANHTLHAVFKQLSPGHDIAIKSVTSKTAVGQGYPLTIKVTAINIGSYTETFNITNYVNANHIASQSVTIESGAAIVITCTWNTTGFAKGNYTISTYAWPVPSEVDINDNNLTSWVVVAIVGDIAGPKGSGFPDGKVDIRDIAYCAARFGCVYQPLIYPLPTDWDPNCDIDNNGKIDIKDIATIAKHYGETIS